MAFSTAANILLSPGRGATLTLSTACFELRISGTKSSCSLVELILGTYLSALRSLGPCVVVRILQKAGIYSRHELFVRFWPAK